MVEIQGKPAYAEYPDEKQEAGLSYVHADSSDNEAPGFTALIQEGENFFIKAYI
jgi:hypothetical protein